MVKFLNIRIQDYKSIEDITLQLAPGIYKVLGESQGYSSNGSGKTSVTQAIVLGLYNRDFSSAKVDEVSNRITGRGFKITIELLKDSEPYTIINDRHRKKFEVFSKGKKVATGAIEGVRFVTKLLGMGYDTFCLTHFITARTVNHITENLSNPALFNDILQIAQLGTLDKKLLECTKTTRDTVHDLKRELVEAESKANRDAVMTKYDLAALRSHLKALEDKNSILTMEILTVTKKHRPELDTLLKETQKLDNEIKNIQEALTNGVCPTCSNLLVSASKLKVLEKELAESQLQYTYFSDAHTEALIKWQKLEREFAQQKQQLEIEISECKTNIRIAEELELAMSVTTSRNLDVIKQELKQAIEMQRLITYARQEIKEGNVVKSLLENFFEIVQSKMNDYAALINMNGTLVTVTVNKLGMGIDLEKEGHYVPVSTLSNGEKTRLSLLILIAMLDAMKEVSNSETNYLVFDEASASFDASGVEELEALFSYMKGLGQSSFVITHGSEMDRVAFDYELIVSKTGGLSNLG